MDKVRVAIRVRPLNRREKELASQSVIAVNDSQCALHHVNTLEKSERKHPPKAFTFDNCFDSFGDGQSQTKQQEEVFNALGRGILDNAFQGYNACIFAYGQTGSGKSFTMMGTAEAKGLIPRLSDALFEQIASTQDPCISHKVEVSYMEIYNEKVHDLLDPKGSRQALKVREHQILGPYVDGLSQLAVSSYEEIEQLIEEGNKARTVASTNMNSESSRSHAVFTVLLTQIITDTASGVSGEKVSKLSMVDLAGSERAVKTGAVGDRLKEGSNINKSLTTLGLVISKLAEQPVSSKSKSKDNFIPYRDSVLTWLLKDNLGGNSRTVMVATVSPAADNYEETLSTLRYADRAKRIVNHAVVNEDPNAKLIRELRHEVETLREQLLSLREGRVSVQDEERLNEKLHESEKLITNLSETWENKLKKTERMQQERQQHLEKMGISVEASGISVEKNKYYLVNLNADPSLNEMLVYYLKDITLVGRPDVNGKPNDIQLSGVRIEQHHCQLSIVNGELFIQIYPNAITFVNGTQLQEEKVQLRHGDRILWGFNYFFRVNCPRTSNGGGYSEPQTPAQPIDYNFAREELMLKELSNDPIQAAIQNLEKQHEVDKKVALEKQRQEYEKQFQQLRSILSPTTPYGPYERFDPIRGPRMTPCTPTSQMKIEKWAQDREDMFKRSLDKLRQGIMKANTLVKEANFFAEEMQKQTTFQVTLQIPPQNLSANRKHSGFVSEPAILVKRKGKPNQVWALEKLVHKLVVMRELYDDTQNNPTVPNDADPFYENQENHHLVGVANVFLECLFRDVVLSYHVPIISQQGEVAGRLLVEISRIAGQFPQERFADTLSQSSGESGGSQDYDDMYNNTITCRIAIKQATGLPPSLSNFVFCQYQFFNQPGEVVAPIINNAAPNHRQADGSISFKFDHVRDFTVELTEDLIEDCAEGALSIEVWGHRSATLGIPRQGFEVNHQMDKVRSLVDRWSELTRKIEFWVEVQELSDGGDYVSVEVTPNKDCLTGGVYQLRQGQQRRIVCRVKPVSNSGTLPLICEAITNISIGSICGRLQCQKQLDSYTEEDLNVLRNKWKEALNRRKMYLDQQIQKLINKPHKTERECEREQSLVDQWISLTEERNAVTVPAPGSNIPGAPADWNPPMAMEHHVPVIFLDLNADDFSAQGAGDTLPIAGLNTIVPKEICNKFYPLQIIKCYEKDVCAVASWDSSIHDNSHLNKITLPEERIYLIVKAVVRLSHPAPMELVLRKRLSVNVYKKQSLTSKFKIFMGGARTLYESGVMYEVVSNIPKASEELENRESLAQMAASTDDVNMEDGETYIEKYTKGVTSVESILMLDRLRQSVAVKELKGTTGRPTMRKTASVPNMSQMDNMENGLGAVLRSGSVMDLNAQLTGVQETSQSEKVKQHRFSLPGPASASPSPGPVKMTPRMTTLHEECNFKEEETFLYPEEEEDSVLEEEECDEIMPEEEYSDVGTDKVNKYFPASRFPLTQSRTLDSLNEMAVMKAGTPSTISSGYGSGAVSSTTLSDDSLSVHSVSVDGSPDKDFSSLPQTSESSVVSSGESDSSDTKTVVNQHMEALHISEEENSTPEATPKKGQTVNPPTVQNMQNCTNTNKEILGNDTKMSVSNNNIPNHTEVVRRTVKGNRNSVNRKSLPATFANGSMTTSDVLDPRNVASIPDWCNLGESVLIRPYNYAGVIAYVGPTDFKSGIWIGVELDVPMGKHDGNVNGIQYFRCAPKCGMFVKPEKLILDRRGKAMRASRSITTGSSGRSGRSPSSGHMTRSRSTVDRLSEAGQSKHSSRSNLDQ